MKKHVVLLLTAMLGTLPLNGCWPWWHDHDQGGGRDHGGYKRGGQGGGRQGGY